MTSGPEEPQLDAYTDRPAAVLAIQATLLVQAGFDVVMGFAVGGYYGWTMSLLGQVPGNTGSQGLTLVAGALPAGFGLLGAALGVGTAWGIASSKPWSWLAGVGLSAIHVFLNPCCSPLALLVLVLLLRADVRDWIQ